MREIPKQDNWENQREVRSQSNVTTVNSNSEIA